MSGAKDWPRFQRVFKRLLARVRNAVRLINLADHGPVILEGDRNELFLTRFGELGLQRRAFPIEIVERIRNLFLQFRRQVIGRAKPGRRKGLRGVEGFN